MKRIPMWKLSLPALYLCTLLAACGTPSSPGASTTGEPASPSGNSATTSTASNAAPTTSTTQSGGCPTFLPSAPCADYASVSGTSKGVDLPWVASGSVKAQLEAVNGTYQLSVQDKCGPLSGPATITGNTMVVGDIAVGAVGCEGDVSAQHLWVMAFLKRPIEMTYTDGVLKWMSGSETLSFKSE